MSSSFSSRNQPYPDPTFREFFRARLWPMVPATLIHFKYQLIGALVIFWIILRLGTAFSGTEISYYYDRVFQSKPAGNFEVRWLGVAGVELRYRSDVVLIDPFFSRPSISDILLRRDVPVDMDLADKMIDDFGFETVQGVFVSHSHYDHSMDAPYFVAQTETANLYGSESTLNIGRGFSLPENRLKLTGHGDVYRFGALKVTVLESRHGPALFGRVPFPGTVDKPLKYPTYPSAYRLGKTYSYFVEYPGGCIVHHGSAETLPHTYSDRECDTVLLGAAGRASTEDYLDKVAGKLGATRILPIHFDNFFVAFNPNDPPLLWNVKLGEFVETATEKGYEVKFLTLLKKERL